MSKGIERLTCLRTLDKVVVSGDKKACKFECLRNLNHLRGELYIHCIGVDVGEINKAEFKNKTKLLSFRIELSSEEDVSNTNEEALEDFQPPPNLELLFLRGYRGASCLSLNWIMSLTKLRRLSLDCGSHIGFERLSLGKLPYLELLWIRGMGSVKSVGDEFVGMERFSSSSLVIAFPKLQSLQFRGMGDWEEWDCGASGRGEEQIKIMPYVTEWRKQKTGSRTVAFLRSESMKIPCFPKSSSPAVVSFHDDIEDELPEIQTAIHRRAHLHHHLLLTIETFTHSRLV
ncbi:hypothetical protein LWI28_010792 [Acer negundo]|uniref:R13L1/DRL21-like LRR repeat region domain-containing protein n=1 Tax=Acer negundo TaxID=4023 RepID=A0AAD5ID78_ACENE|nr:hypothetical protein LWI28_010792 [Acer negundo]